MIASSTYWLSRWLDDNGIVNEWEINQVLSRESGFRSICDAAEQANEALGVSRPAARDLPNAIVAGRRLDLSGQLTCTAYECLREDIDTAFKQIWHYFDSIVVEGLSPRIVVDDVRRAKDDRAKKYVTYSIREQARLLLYLRNIGADKYTLFEHKTFAFCQDHWLEHAKTLGIREALDESKRADLVRHIVDFSEFRITPQRDGSWSVAILKAPFDKPDHLVVLGAKPTPKKIAHHILVDLATATISDVELARRLSLPLAEGTSMPWMARVRSRARTTGNADKARQTELTPDDVALQLRLPVFDRLPTADLLKLRDDERPDFEAFRSALRQAIRERVASASYGESASAIAKSIDEDYIRPGLAEIERKLRGGRQALIRKTAIDLAIGTVAAGVASMTSIPLMIAGGVAALGSAVPLAPALHNYIDDTRAAKMTDLYFLWRMEQRASHT